MYSREEDQCGVGVDLEILAQVSSKMGEGLTWLHRAKVS